VSALKATQIPAAAVLLIFLAACAAPSQGAHRFKEKDYQNAWCAEMRGKAEVILDDKTRVDCLTDEYAIEVDYARKWAEAVGQSLYYAEKTGRRPGILLIMEKPTDTRYRERLQLLGDRHQIMIWETQSQDLGH
jgi:hypothetical protein